MSATKRVCRLIASMRVTQLPQLPADGETVWTYREALTPPALPRRLLIVGAGAIGIEFASFYRALGADVTVVEMAPRILEMAMRAAVEENADLVSMSIPSGSHLELVDQLMKTLAKFSSAAWLAATALFAAAGPVAAQELRIGYVNSEKVLRDALPAQTAQKKLEAEFSKRERELNDAAAKLKGEKLTVFLKADGKVDSLRFDSPIEPKVITCVFESLSSGRFVGTTKPLTIQF